MRGFGIPWRQWRQLDFRTLVLSGGCVTLVWVFLALADEVFEGDMEKLDTALLLALREKGNLEDPLGPPWLEGAFRDVTALGSFSVLTLFVIAFVGYMFLARRYRLGLLMLASSCGGAVWSHLLKDLFDRPRPDLVPHVVEVFSHSFPSGHSLASASIYLTLGGLVANVATSRRLKIFALVTSFGLTFLVGLSRVYLGVHYPSDVLAGWILGFAWAILCWTILWNLRIRWIQETSHLRR